MKRLLIALLTLMGLAPATVAAQDDRYPVAFDKDADRTHSVRVLNSVGLSGANVPTLRPEKMYDDLTHRALVAKAGQTVLPSVSFSTSWMHTFVYIDKDNNGQFDVEQPNYGESLSPENELVAFSALELASGRYYNSAGEEVSGANIIPPAFTVPADMAPGYYMMRYKVDWNSVDPAGRVDREENIITNGGAIADVRLRIYDNDQVLLTEKPTTGGKITLFDGSELDQTQWTIGSALTLIVAPEKGYKLSQIKVRHGILTADSLVGGIAQYAEEIITADDVDLGLLNIDGSLVDGDMEFTAEFVENPDADDNDRIYSLVFNDEFDQEDGSRPNPAKWKTSERANATWNRWISPSPKVAFIRDGALVCRAIPNPDTASDPVPMITGAVETKDLFSFAYGKVEVRLKTVPHYGSFPAAWMMPQPPCEGWPYAGEIDIFESIDAQNKAHHTVHSNWTYILNQTGNPQSTFSESVNIADWHVYGLIWENNIIKWTVDGKEVGSYAKSTDKNALSNGQWPFSRRYYIILNQSVGNGSWAGPADTNYTYETMFDYVRVYRKVATGIEQVDADPVKTHDNAVYDLQGRRLGSYSGNLNSQLPKGIYIRNGRKFVVR
ncbi:MAG: glycoside hydrolase family 16 protein [Prevotella sp.]|nr:glycoside hydrolase family 16 protein [Prevotella sp.]